MFFFIVRIFCFFFRYKMYLKVYGGFVGIMCWLFSIFNECVCVIDI